MREKNNLNIINGLRRKIQNNTKMGWIEERIKAEHRKHKNLEWEKLAEIKIVQSLKYFIDQAPDVDYVGEYLKGKLEEMTD